MKTIKVMRDGRRATAVELRCVVEGKPLPVSRGYAALVGELYCIASTSRSHAMDARKLAERFDAAAVRVNRMAEILKELNDAKP